MYEHNSTRGVEAILRKERKTKAVVYKRARFLTEGPLLQPLLAKALTKYSTVGARRESLALPDEGSIWRLIAQFRIEDEMVFGMLMRYAPGTDPAFVEDDESAKFLTLQQLSAPVSAKGKRRELVDGMLFFGACDNHLVMMQSTALRSDHLETHLQWLLHSAGVVEATNTLQLVDEVPQKVKNQLAKKKIKKFDIGGALVPLAAPPASPASRKSTATVKSAAVSTSSLAEENSSSRIIAAIKTLMSKDEAANLKLDALAGANFEYRLEIKYQRTTTEDGQKLMDTLGAALRHAEGVDTTLHLEGGGRLRGEELRLNGKVRIDTYSGVPVTDEVFEAMRTWLLEQLKSGALKA